MPVEKVQEHLIEEFIKWGMPEAIKVDHGRPLGDPTGQTVPPLALWLIGMDVRVIYIRPATPTDNPKVERMQGVTANWAEPHRCHGLDHLQERLDLAVEIQREHYHSRSCGRKSRIQCYPQLTQKGRRFDPLDFQYQRIYQYLKDFSWTRKVSKKGQFEIFGAVRSAGVKFHNTSINIRLDPNKEAFIIMDHEKNIIKQIPAQPIFQKWLNHLFQYQRTSSE